MVDEHSTVVALHHVMIGHTGEDSDGMTRLNEKMEDVESAVVATPRSIALWLARLLRAGLVVLSRLADRALHRARRASARRRVAGTSPITSVLFVCHGNICRSPFAAAVFAHSMRARGYGRVRVASAGFVGPRRRSPAAARTAALERNFNLSAHRSTLITSAALGAADLVVVMDADHRAMLRRRFGEIRGALLVLGDLDPNTISRRTIADPWGCDDAVYAASYDRIVRCVQSLTSILTPSEADTG